MAHKQLLFRTAAREKILAGVNTMASAVRITLGPKSKCVLIEKQFGKPIVCNDGVTIAKEIELKDPEENLGAQMIREAAERTGDTVGDGTSTSTILAQEIFSEGLHNIAAGASAIDLKRGLDRGLKIAENEIVKLSHPVGSVTELAQIATISAHNDPFIGDFVAKAMDKVGKEGVVTVEEAKGTEIVLDVVEGMQFDRGYISPYFVTDPEKMIVELQDPYVLLCEKKIGTMKDLVPLLEDISKTASSLLIISDNVESDALATLVVNKIRGVLRCAAVKAPGFGENRHALLQDIAILTGGVLITEEMGLALEHVSLKDLGRASRVIIDKDKTTLVGGLGDKDLIKSHINEIRQEIEKTKSDYELGKLKERLAKLAGGVAVIHVGAPSEVELKNKKEALDDAINSTKAAMAEGIVPGGGLSLLRAAKAILSEEKSVEGDEKTGMRILRKALESPTRQIAENSGADGGVVIDKMMSNSGAYGFDAAKNEYVDLLQAGIIDPTKVVRVALENAVSVAGILLLTEATLTTIPEDIKEGAERRENLM